MNGGTFTDRRKRRAGAWLALAVFGVSLPSFSWAEENQVFFRGGFAGLTSNRANEVFTDVYGRNNLRNDSSIGSYVGAGLDLGMHKNAFGVHGMSLVGELGIELKRFDSQTVTQAVPSTCAGALGAAAPGCSVRNNTVAVTMLTVDVAPKLKFREGEKLRPWVIPIGVDFHVISPPSNATTYLDMGVQWGAGMEYNIWGPFNVGIDARYHLAANMTQTTNNFYTAGAYLGLLY
ncbi:MAG: outer membrane beta-barrel protein [Nitrospirota bacterium]|nr:outer membrane beta-barrel protein [Nitrospirota bacterium]MDE3225585.1 outer membrane beta-barrel protein [Nitrospirota bacterium]MDE3243084.1 outer membrane beta-barrel protein [Nitrospirota bacterium]